jgi:hypothetical protein
MITRKISRWAPLYILLALAVTGLTSCEKIVSGLNDNPNNPTDASAELLLTGLELGNIEFQEGHSSVVAGIWAGYFTGIDRSYKSLQYYVASGSDFTAYWQDVYYAVLQQERLLEQRAAPLNNRRIIGIARILKAHAAGSAAALWGDVPYTQAANIDQYPNPVYDPQLQVYDSVQTLLDSAIADLTSGTGTSPAAADIHFTGGAAQWIAVAHTLKARFYLDVRDYVKAFAETAKGITSSAGSLAAPHSTSTGSQNFYSYGKSLTDINSDGAYITTLLDSASTAYKGNSKTDERARLNYYFTYTLSGGAKTKFTPNTTSTTSLKGIFAQAASYALVTYQENLLTKAEAGLRTQGFAEGLADLNAYRSFMNGGGYIDASYRSGNFKYEAYIEDDLLPGGIANQDGRSREDALLREILKERYVTFFAQQIGFNDVRRTRKDPAGANVSIPPNIGSKLPERFLYSQDEINTNSNVLNPLPGVFDPTPVNK